MASSADRTRLARALARALGAPIGVLAVVEQAGIEVASWSATDGPAPAVERIGAGDLATLDGLILVEDLAADPRFAGGCWTRAAPAARALALATAEHADGGRLGVAAVLDTRRRAWTREEGEDLRDLAALALGYEALRRQSERLSAEAARLLQAGDERYRVLFERAAQPIVVSSAEPGDFATILEGNDAAVATYGYTREEIAGKSNAVVFAPGQEPIIGAMRLRMMAGEWVRGRVTHVRKDGTYFPADVVMGLTELEGQRRMVSFVHDATDRVRAEEALVRARETADAANRAKSAFLANMSHEIRTPMNAVLGYTQLLERSPSLTVEQRAYLQVVRRAGDHLLGLIDDVLEMSKIEAGRREIDRGDVDLGALTDDLVRLFALRARAKGISFTVQHAPGVPRVVISDEGRLRQMLVNLVGNALKFTDRGGVTLRLDVETGEAGERRLVLRVEDTGPGIEPEMLGRLFQPFSQGRLGLNARGGTGLGLAISREYARLLGGDLTVESVLDQGSVFRLDLPCHASTSSSGSHRAAPRGRVVGLADRTRPPPRILVVDDDADSRLWIALLLGEIGFEVRQAQDGAEALSLFMPWQPHLVVMDMNMPVMDGFAAIHAMRALPEGHRAVVMAVTASAFKHEEAAILEAGANAVLRKPCREAALFATIQQLLGVTYVHAELPPERVPAETGGDEDRVAALPPELPAELSAALSRAARVADYELLTDLIARLPSEHAAMAETLSALADRYSYDEIEALLRA